MAGEVQGLPLYLFSRQIVQERTKTRPGSFIPVVIHGQVEVRYTVQRTVHPAPALWPTGTGHWPRQTRAEGGLRRSAQQKISGKKRPEQQIRRRAAEYGNESADAFLAELERQGTDYVDLRPLFEENGIYSNWFFRTDHHWKPEAAFFAWQALTDELEERYGLAADPALTDPANWDTRVLEHFFLGSQGKRVGSLYAGADDITLYTPKFDSELTYSCPAYGFTRIGPFETSVCFPERVARQDWFNGNPYTYYAGGDYPIATITNHKNPDGPRVVLLRDSFACALTPFLALSCSELTTIDLRYFEGDLLDTIAGLEPDIALTLYTASTTRLDNLFQYEHTEE